MPRKKKSAKGKNFIIDHPVQDEQGNYQIPTKLTDRKVTPSQLKRGIVQDGFKTLFAITGLREYFNSMIRGVKSGDIKAMEQFAKIYGLLSDGKTGASVFVNQTNSNSAKAEAAALSQARGSMATPDEMFRLLDSERAQRTLNAGKIEYIPTPVNYEPEVDPDLADV